MRSLQDNYPSKSHNKRENTPSSIVLHFSQPKVALVKEQWDYNTNWGRKAKRTQKLFFKKGHAPEGSKLRQTKWPESSTETFVFAEKYIYLGPGECSNPWFFFVPQSLGGYPLDPEMRWNYHQLKSKATSLLPLGINLRRPPSQYSSKWRLTGIPS